MPALSEGSDRPCGHALAGALEVDEQPAKCNDFEMAHLLWFRCVVGCAVALVAPVAVAAGDAESEDVVLSDQASATGPVSELWLDPVFDAEIDFLIDEYGLSRKTATSRTHDALVVNDVRSLAREHPEVIDSWMTH